jgi:peptidoglycan-associated lipoprotein
MFHLEELVKRLPFLALLIVTVAVAACGGKRPPVVATSAGAGSGSSHTTAGSGTGTQSLDEGPDIQAVDSGALGESALSDESGEGGPLSDIHFEYDQASLTDEARSTLERHAAWIKAHPGLRVGVEGHCDERGTVEYNLALGDQRARAASEYLVSLGVDAGRLTTVSYGKERPLDAGAGEAAWAKNRRVHFAVSR